MKHNSKPLTEQEIDAVLRPDQDPYTRMDATLKEVQGRLELCMAICLSMQEEEQRAKTNEPTLSTRLP